MIQSQDANVGFTLVPEARAKLIHILDALAQALPQASALLIDKAGRIVDIPRKPPGVNIEAISALAAGCHASTNELAESLREKGFALLFEHGDDRQVYVWPVADRALLIVIFKGAAGVEQLEAQMEGSIGKELEAVITDAREPLRAVPPPRIEPVEIPAALGEKGRELNAFIMNIQVKRPASLAGEAAKQLLKAREDMVQAMSKRDWEKSSALCDETLRWLKSLP